MKLKALRIGTRGSDLALAQAKIVASKLTHAFPGLKVRILPIKTTGDRLKSPAELKRLIKKGKAKGLFVKELEKALLTRKIDVAVHSLKDVPTEQPERLILTAILERDTPNDLFIGRQVNAIEKLPRDAVVAAGSPRRQALLRAAYPNLKIVDIRGNLDTRIETLMNPKSKLDGLIVAAAGARRLFANNGLLAQLLPLDVFVPAPGQGALAVECRERDDLVRKALAVLNHDRTAREVAAERALLRRFEAGCTVPFGAYAVHTDDDVLKLTVVLASPDGATLFRTAQVGHADEPDALAAAVESTLRSQGADRYLEMSAAR